MKREEHLDGVCEPFNSRQKNIWPMLLHSNQSKKKTSYVHISQWNFVESSFFSFIHLLTVVEFPKIWPSGMNTFSFMYLARPEVHLNIILIKVIAIRNISIQAVDFINELASKWNEFGWKSKAIHMKHVYMYLWRTETSNLCACKNALFSLYQETKEQSQEKRTHFRWKAATNLDAKGQPVA